MTFTTIDFGIFLPIVFLLYWFVTSKNLKGQNFFLLIVSYFFYGYWDWRFLFLIIFSSFIDFAVGIGLGKTEVLYRRKVLLVISIITNIGLLGVFKYFNFFSDSFSKTFTFIGYPIKDQALLDIVLPVGISFYTFQTLSYSIDVYKKKLKPTTDIISFFAFVSFFPQLVAGPIERAVNLLPQFYKKRSFDYANAVDGMRQILWGIFKKMIIADNCAIQVNNVFENYASLNGSTLFLGVFLFSIQIYCDFSGYSDIAIGTSRLFGFSLMRNFAYPYFSRDIAEFWRRWHISLSTWFRDYVYFPLGGSRDGMIKCIRNILIVFTLSGLWHGANWTFIVWGVFNALLFLPLMIFKKNRVHTDIIAERRFFPTLKETVQVIITFCLIMISWVFFRAQSISHALSYLYRFFSKSLFSPPEIHVKYLILAISIFMLIEWLQRKKEHALQINNKIVPEFLRWSIYGILVLLILFFHTNKQEFIYFQF